jgi:hypothetical protein
MDKAELLATFTSRVDQFEKFQSYIAKARDQSSKFAPAVVEKVVRDNEAKSIEITGEIAPLLSEIEQVLEDVRRSREEALDSAKESQFRLEELELRLAIGDLTADAFDKESASDKAVVKSTEKLVAELEAEKQKFESAIEHWTGLSGQVSDSNGAGAYEELEAEEDVDLGATPLHAGRVGSRVPEAVLEADVSYDPTRADEDNSEIVDLADSEVEVVFDEQNGDFEMEDIDLLNNEQNARYDDVRATDDKPRKAVLLYQEGTAEEQIYPFGADVLSLGRGRDNDVQVKNDSKVSRYHCKLYRRGPNFYIEDNKSANGTLVNGELITERRLFGGEEVIIGETFFRFRILD